MNSLAVRLLALNVPEGKLAVCFAGQAGVIIKTPAGELLGVDLYLSDCCNRFYGQKRLMPKLLEPGEIEFDFVVSTHAHYDHFDPDSMPILLAPQKTRFLGALDCMDECKKLGIPNEKCTWLEEGKSVRAGSMNIIAMPCDHGPHTPHAVGLCIECSGKKVSVAGDTCFREDIAAEHGALCPDMMFAPINGAYGNLNEEEAAKFFSIAKPKLAVPCHYWNFAEHHGDPGKFKDEMITKYPTQPFMFMAMGEIVLI
ncbi:MAG TPA: MBL fold metallo-hydrolase [Bacillota bacterium]|nr:MBL fold metallo-hydrolase [Clostridiales bacterium]HPT86094.1 MBL fold metallo-hydrolase [Bacillota bacterium]